MLGFREFYLIKYSRNSKESDSLLSIFTIYSSGGLDWWKNLPNQCTTTVNTNDNYI